MASLVVEDNGVVMAGYTNGQTKAVGQIEMAFFRNQQGLRPMGGGLWAGALAAGDAVLGTPGQGNLGTLTAGALEQSNVDLTAELVGMITAQRAYQANAQTIKTQDQVLQTLVNMR
jgi:flagellar hook protein FlgE